ncbi:LacI family DNA-binding transcriptional regulator [Actinomyces sp. MRS3W]|uniref:LacI family DNA-binding transcriptional regulator n=1 Tax=Actinomyces sp. MRS3W TaxID=2800796 RepID=UPI0028FD5BEF|nr:LacI family DNA-binding transcriptional regulator [Actinomyces sp. MRS3W]MDU0347716.1 LacI family DNA-binding transcriptional regulator [Actinomyces sp. MRS3W]
MASRERVTLDTIAAAANVSRATVSKAINGRQDVSARTRRQVLNLAEELGYEAPTSIDRSSPIVTIVFDSLDTYYTNRVLAGAVAAAHDRRAVLDVRTFTDHREAGSDHWVKQLGTQGHLALIVVTMALSNTQVEAARSLQLPVITVDPAQETPDGVLEISSTNWNGGMAATQHLLSLGHTRIAFVAGPERSLPARERLLGFRSAMMDAGLDVDPALVLGDSYTYATGLRSGLTLLDLEPDRRPTAIMCACDVSAIGVYEAARERGVSVPSDLSVVGYDDTFLAEYAAPPLTTIHQALETMGARAVEAALDLADDSAGTRRTIGSVKIPTRLVERMSTAPPRADT